MRPRSITNALIPKHTKQIPLKMNIQAAPIQTTSSSTSSATSKLLHICEDYFSPCTRTYEQPAHHHLKPDEWCPYREGVTLPGADEHGTFVEAGLRIPVTIEEQIPENTRVTLKFRPGAEEANKDVNKEVILADAVGPDEPREDIGYYWGFNVRKAGSLSDVFTECAYEGGYDVTIGTSERGASLETIYSEEEGRVPKKFKHLLIVFGGVAGLEVAVKNDEELQKLGVFEAKDVFDKWINVCPGQGSRTIRTEEAVWIGLMGLRRLVVNNE
jgi:predicted SPOUT superfamily RNA methylase MTH1